MTTKDKDIQVCFNPHFDAVSLWLGSFGGADSPCDISRGVFAAKRGVPRLLEFFRRYGIKTTWHITGHSMESFPKASEMIAKDGHEIGIHGYSHENPLAMSPQQERDVLDKSIALCRNLTGKNPKGYATPWAEFTSITVDLLLERGISHEFSMMEEDCFPYYLRTGDSWTGTERCRDYAKNAEDWMKPWDLPQPRLRGNGSRYARMVEIPLSWHLDDAPPTMFVKTAPNSQRLGHGTRDRPDLDRLLRLDLPQPRLRHRRAVVPVGAAPGRCGQASHHVGAGAAGATQVDHILRHRGARMVTHEEGALWPRICREPAEPGAVRVEQDSRRSDIVGL